MLTNMAAITLMDGEATAVSHVYSPVRSADGTPTWVDKEHNNGVAIGYSRLTYRCREPIKQDGVYRHTLTLAVPFVNYAIADHPELICTARFKGEFLYPATMSTQQRKNVTAMVYRALLQGQANTLGDNIVEQSEPY